MKTILLIFLLLIVRCVASAQVPDELMSLGMPYLHEKEIRQDLFIKTPNINVELITITCFDVSKATDTTQVYSINNKSIKSKRKDVSYFNVQLSTKERSSVFHSLYKNIILKNQSLPAGSYHTSVTLKLKNNNIIKKSFVQYVDSSLSVSSTAHKEFDNIYGPKKVRSFLGLVASKQTLSPKLNNARSVIKSSVGKVHKTFSSKGLTVSYREIASRTLADVYYQDRYVGYYEVNTNEPIADRIDKRKAQLAGNIASGVGSSLENNQTVFSQIKQLYSGNKKSKVTGNIYLRTNAANGQEEYSENENNFYELGGQVEMPVMSVPVMLEGYYTSQDVGRVAKASYFRLHYDSEQAKAKLLALIAGYNNKYDEVLAKGNGMQNIYGTYLNKIQQDKEKLWSDMAAETDISDIGKFKADTSGLMKEISKSYEGKLTDVSGGATAKKDAVMKRYDKAMDKYKNIQELEKKSQYYLTLLEQYRNNNYFDSVMAYDKLKDINKSSLEDKSYKQLSKSAGSFLPDGESNKFISGLTNLDAGIFSKQVSSYTLNGQTIKGLDAGYDIGFCETGFTYGRVEYVGRDGSLDKYAAYSGRASFKPVNRQKTTLVYYGYMPSGKMLKGNAFFDKVDDYMPSFKAPIHIVSVMHQAAITNHTTMEVEGATSFRNRNEFQRDNMKLTDKMAYRITAEESIPKTTIDLKGEYEHVGQKFENNTLPLNLSGTDRYSAGARGAFLKNFLTIAVEYNYLLQQNFASKSANSKWGFEVKTTSKRYPSASLSYKPFSTFRSVADTFNIQQRPILGEVWLGKLSYQFKKKFYTLRLTAIYNKNTALVDTMESNSNIAQFNALYTTERINLMLNAGQTQMKSSQLPPIHGKTNFLSVMAAYLINSQWNVNAGQDIGTIKSGLSRYSMSVGAGYRFKNIPLSLQASCRYNTYKITEGQAWKNIYSGMVDMNWRFRFKTNEKI